MPEEVLNQEEVVVENIDTTTEPEAVPFVENEEVLVQTAEVPSDTE